MAAVHTVVDVPELRCVIRQFDGLEPSPDAPPIRAFSDDTRARHAAILQPGQPLVLHLEPLICVFDAQWEDLSCTAGLPLRDDVAAADALDVMVWEPAKVLELRYPESRSFKAVLDDVYKQASGYSTGSRLRDLGKFMRVLVRPSGGWLVQVETVLRVTG